MEKVAKVIAGDAFETESGYLIFLHGVNAPEFWGPGAEEAADKLRAILKEGQEVSLSVTDAGRGAYIAKVRAGEKDVNAEMKKFYPRKRQA